MCIRDRLIIDDLTKGVGIRFVWMRIFSTYGPLDEGSWLIPNIVDSLVNEEKVKLTKGEQNWSYLHAYDLASAFQTVIRETQINGIVNVGNPKTVVLKDAIEMIAMKLGAKGLLGFGKMDYRPDQVMKLEPACESLTAIGWSPIVSFENGVAQTIQWRHRETVEPLRCVDGQEVVFNLPSRR